MIKYLPVPNEIDAHSGRVDDPTEPLALSMIATVGEIQRITTYEADRIESIDNHGKAGRVSRLPQTKRKVFL